MGRKGLGSRSGRPQKKMSMHSASIRVRREFSLELLEKKRLKDKEMREKVLLRQRMIKRFRFNYNPSLNVLLVGEANCSFARALIRQYRCDIASKLRKMGIQVPSDEEIMLGVDPTAEMLEKLKKKREIQAAMRNHGASEIYSKEDDEEMKDNEDDEDEEDYADYDDEEYGVIANEYLFSNCGRNLIVTCYDSITDSMEKYEDLPEILSELASAGVKVIFDTDCTVMNQTLSHANLIPTNKFDRIVFNFPHVGSGETDKELAVRENQQLLLNYLTNAMSMVRKSKTNDKTLTTNIGHGKRLDRGGQITITVKNGMPYDNWKIPVIARMLNHNQAAAQKMKETKTQAHIGSLAARFPKLMLLRSVPFIHECYDGYAHRRTIGYKEGLSKSENEEIVKQGAKTFIFVRAPIGFVDKSLGLAHEEEEGDDEDKIQKKKAKATSGKRGKTGRSQRLKDQRVQRLKKRKF